MKVTGHEMKPIIKEINLSDLDRADEGNWQDDWKPRTDEKFHYFKLFTHSDAIEMFGIIVRQNVDKDYMAHDDYENFEEFKNAVSLVTIQAGYSFPAKVYQPPSGMWFNTADLKMFIDSLTEAYNIAKELEMTMVYESDEEEEDYSSCPG